jgi:hypothetical protein
MTMKKITKNKMLWRIKNSMTYALVASVLALCCRCNGSSITPLPSSTPLETEDHTTDTPAPETSIPEHLKGTKWKLAGIVDAETGVRKELEPKDCEKCYTLIFDMDSTIFLYSTSNEGRMSINDINDKNIPHPVGRTKVMECCDGELYLHVHGYITSYVRDGDELKFFYQADEKESYLLYKLVQSTPEHLKDTK